MTPTVLQWLQRLARGERLERCDVVPGLWVELQALGVPPAEGPGHALGFCLPPELLEADAIRGHGLPAGIGVDCRLMVESTNAELVASFQHRHALLAECQSGGRGRNGRHWRSPFAGGLWFSFGYRFALSVERLGPLTLAVGIGLAEALDLPQLRLKWPNDLLIQDAKLGGILIEARSGDGATEAVIGVGINLRTRFRDEVAPDQRWTELDRIDGQRRSRNRLAAQLLGTIDRVCARFEADGFAPFLPAWSRLDALAGRVVRVERGIGPVLLGRAMGISADGLLQLVDAQGVEHRIASGEVRVRGL